MTRAKTQGPGGKLPRAVTHGGSKPKRAATHSNLFNDLEAAIDSLDQSSARHAASKEAEPAPKDKPAAKLPPPARRPAPGPSPDSPKLAPRTAPPKPPPGAERAAVIRARESRAASEIAVDEVEEVIPAPAARVPPRPPPATRPPPIDKPALDADGLPPIAAPPVRATPRPVFGAEPRPEPLPTTRIPARLESIPDPDEFATEHVSRSYAVELEARPDSEPASGLSIDINLEESQPAAAAYPEPVEGIAEDAVAVLDAIEGVVQPSIEPLSIAILDEPPYIAAAKQAIAVAGHRVAAAASGQAGIEQIKSLLRTGIADVLLVGLPGGEELVDTALALAPRRPVVIAVMQGKPADVVRKTIALGADLAVARPLDLDKLAPALLAAARLSTARASAPLRPSDANLRGRLDAMADQEPGTLQPYDAFERVFELEIKRSKRYGYPIAVALFAVSVEGEPPPGMLGIIRARAGNALIQSIRDIDLATELERDRFLVLLPYTTRRGAAEVARRILGAVTGGTPITAGGKPFPPKIVGAVAGAQVGEPLSISRLLREVTQALEEAVRDGAELAVPMGTPE